MKRIDARPRPLRRAFRGFGTEVELRAWPAHRREAATAAALAGAVRFLRAAERRLSRFDPASELSRVNRRAGRSTRLSPLTLRVVDAALTAAEATGGLFDPTIYAALRAAGYDRSFDELARLPQGASVFAQHGPAGQYRAVRLDRTRRVLTLPAGTGLDLGGIAKGWLADRVLARLRRRGPALVDLGGDVALSAPPAGVDAWEVEVTGPYGGALGTLRVRRGGIATSGVTRRAWATAAGPRHHLIDPRTGAPAESDLVAVTVVAPTATAAEVAAKAALLAGLEAGRHALTVSPDLFALLVPANGTPLVANGGAAGRLCSWEPSP